MAAAESGSASSSVDDSSLVEATIISGSDRNESKGSATSPAAASSSSSNVRIPPAKLGRYRIEKQLGQGVMWSVYLARDVQLNRMVALKIPHDLSKVAGNFDERFLREARCAATLNHPNICPVYEVGAQDGFRYLAMGFVDGRPLTDFIKPGRQQPERQIAAAVRKIALAVHEAHQQGIIHRDLKPANVMIDCSQRADRDGLRPGPAGQRRIADEAYARGDESRHAVVHVARTDRRRGRTRPGFGRVQPGDHAVRNVDDAAAVPGVGRQRDRPDSAQVSEADPRVAARRLAPTRRDLHESAGEEPRRALRQHEGIRRRPGRLPRRQIV